MRFVFSFIFLFHISVNCLGQFVINTSSTSNSSIVTINTTTTGNITTTTISYSSGGVLNEAELESYLNLGHNVIIQPSSAAVNEHLQVKADITKQSGGDNTLTLKSNEKTECNGFTISSTSNKLNVIIWVGADGVIEANNAPLGNIITNGGHIWVGGGDGTKTWKGLAVGDDGAYATTSGTYTAIPLYGNLISSGGDILLSAASTGSGSGYVDIDPVNANMEINSGTGNITFIVEDIDFADNNNADAAKIVISCTGIFSIAPGIESNKWTNSLLWEGSISSGKFIGINDLHGIEINNIANLRGLTLGTYDDASYTPLTGSNIRNITLSLSTTIAGPITVYAGDLAIDANLATSGGATSTILLKASGNITQANNIDITTDGADVIYWADTDINNSGSISFGSNGGQDIITNGGDVILAGGAGTTVPTGYANGNTTASGVFLSMGTTRGLINTRKTGATAGSIIIRGKSTGNFDGIHTQDFQFFGHDLTLEGETGNSTNFSVRLGSSNVYNGSNLSQIIDIDNDLTITAINTAASYSGNSLRTGVNPRIYADGNITLNSSGKLDFVLSQEFINISSGKTFSINFDGTASFSTPLGDPTLNTSQGGLVIHSFQQNSFTSAFNSTGWIFNANLSALTIGKPANTGNITTGSATTIAGPITVYGGNININENLNTTSGGTNGDILLKATSDITFAKAKTISSTGGDMIFWSDADGNGAGDIFFASENNYTNPVTISTGGGHLWLGGGSGTTTWNGLTVGDAYAVGNGLRTVGGIFTHYNGITFQGTNISTLGGHIELKGRGKAGDFSSTYSGGIYIAGTGSVNSGGGNINIEAVAQSGTGQKYGFYNLGPNYTFSSGTGNFTLFGDASASAGGTTNTTGNGVLLWSGDISSTGNIHISGKKSSTNGTFGVYSRVNINTTGTNKNITLETDNLNISGGNIASSGQLILKPIDPSTTIGLAGASGVLQIPAAYFISNFTNGFSSIIIGSDIQTGAITVNAFSSNDEIFVKTNNFSLGQRISLGNNDLTLDSRITTLGSVSASNYFQTNGTGKLKKIISNGQSFTFPVGNSSYNPVTITNNTSASDDFSVRVSDAVLDGGTAGNTITDKVVNRTWHIGKTNANASPGIDMTFSWDVSEEGTNMTDYKLSHFGSAWALAAGTSSSVTVNGTTKTMTHTGYTGTFSPFAIGSSTSVLPVTWHSFTAVQQGSGALLQWSTASEQNTKDFVVEYSTNAIRWSPIGTVVASGTSSSLQYYSMLHKDPVKGQSAHFYRIQQRDLDGKFSYSKIARLQMSGTATGMLVYPNPAREVLTVYLDQPQELRIINLNGAEVWRSKLAAGNHQIKVNHLQSGAYIIATPTQQQKVVLD